jgi:hypothetical protein
MTADKPPRDKELNRSLRHLNYRALLLTLEIRTDRRLKEISYIYLRFNDGAMPAESDGWQIQEQTRSHGRLKASLSKTLTVATNASILVTPGRKAALHKLPLIIHLEKFVGEEG